MASLAQVLVVDDDPAIRTSMSLLLESEGYKVAEAEDGLEAIVFISQSIPDVVVSDLNMPRMSGFELLSEVQRRFPQIVTIAMSGAYRDADELPPGARAHGFYAKGAPASNLVATLAYSLRGIERRASEVYSTAGILGIAGGRRHGSNYSEHSYF